MQTKAVVTQGWLPGRTPLLPRSCFCSLLPTEGEVGQESNAKKAQFKLYEMYLGCQEGNNRLPLSLSSAHSLLVARIPKTIKWKSFYKRCDSLCCPCKGERLPNFLPARRLRWAEGTPTNWQGLQTQRQRLPPSSGHNGPGPEHRRAAASRAPQPLGA